MKKTRICPKCNSTEILKVDGDVRGYGAGNNIQAGMTIFSAILVDRYVCCKCGYTEEWIDTKDVDKLKKKFGKG